MEEETKDLKTKAADPGWNDPPIFSYSTQIRQTKGVSLNKRVVFPMSSVESQKPTGENSPTIGSTPPPPSTIEGPPKCASKPVNITNSECLSKENSDHIEISLDVVIRNFNESLLQIAGDNEKETKEIQRRLAIMEKMWNEEKFNQIVKDKIYKLSTALKENRFDDGNSVQMSLMVDHSNVCSNWMAAIRILLSRKKELAD